MRLGGWKARAPYKDAMSPKVLAVIEATLGTLGSDPDPECWIVWGEDPAARYLLLVPTSAGLLQVHARVNVPGEGPRASAKLIRWSRVQIGELAVEHTGGHRIVSFQVEGQVLHATDDDAAEVAAFALRLFAAIDGHPYVPPTEPKRTARPTTTGAKAATGAKAPKTPPAAARRSVSRGT